MPVVTTTFNTTVGQLWASPTWSASDPSKKVHDQLSAWVNAINDPTKIELIHSPGDATSRANSDIVRWLLRAREAETSSDYGIQFAARYAGSSSQATSGGYYDRTAGSANNGSGTYSTIGSSMSMASIDLYSGNHYVAYRADGPLPWFLYSSRHLISGTPYGYLHLLLRVSISDLAAGSYYPASGLGKWVYATRGDSQFDAGNVPTIWTPQNSTAAPYKGAWTGNETLRYPRPAGTYGDGYFFRLGAQYGVTHFLGAPNYDDFLISNTATGVWGDTVVINSVTYTRVGPSPLWVRSS
jgi:hypothetical protein